MEYHVAPQTDNDHGRGSLSFSTPVKIKHDSVARPGNWISSFFWLIEQGYGILLPILLFEKLGVLTLLGPHL